MGAKLQRRDLLKTLGAAAFATTGCPASTSTSASASTIRLPRVNLICHGMLLFWQDRMNPKNGITIYLPDTMGTHEARLSANVGGLPNLILTPGTYALQFMTSGLVSTTKPDKTKHAAFFDDMGTKGLAVNEMKTVRKIQVPYPSDVRHFRKMKFSSRYPPYLNSDTVSMFDVKPSEMYGSHVLTYDGVNSPVMLQGPSGPPVDLTPAAGIGVVNLILYSSVLEMTTANHLHFFNAMLQYTGHPELDLMVDPDPMHKPATTAPDKEKVPNDLSGLDMYDLYEIKDARARDEDPAACLQAWGS